MAFKALAGEHNFLWSCLRTGLSFAMERKSRSASSLKGKRNGARGEPRYVREFVGREENEKWRFVSRRARWRTKAGKVVFESRDPYWEDGDPCLVHSWPKRRLSSSLHEARDFNFRCLSQRINAYRSSTDERKKKKRKDKAFVRDENAIFAVKIIRDRSEKHPRQAMSYLNRHTPFSFELMAPGGCSAKSHCCERCNNILRNPRP